MITTLIFVLIVLCAFALVWWGISRLTIPEPVRTVILVILGLLVLVFIWNFIQGGNLGSLTLRR